MERILNFTITPADTGMRIEQFLRQNEFSRHIITHLKQTPNGICLNGVWSYINQRLSLNDILTIRLIETISSPQIVPVPMNLNIVYEDEDIMVINKPSDMPIHPSINNYDNTLANGVASYFARQNIPFVYRCINRLDRDTTGLLIIAKHMLSAARLSKMIASKAAEASTSVIHREYLAIAVGAVPTQGTIHAAIARKDTSLIERCIDDIHGERAITHFHTLTYKEPYSLVSLKLETGRTHQIRVHMKHLGFPLLGDSLYNPNDMSNKKMQRQALHSYRLHFYHPLTGKEMSFTSPLPDDMNWINLL